MIAARLFFLLILALAAVAGQPARDEGIALDALVKALATPEAAEVSELVETIQSNGIQSQLTDEDLGRILQAGRDGNRDPKEIAALIRVALAACQTCRARYLAPISLDELQTLLKRFTPEAVSREVHARGVNGLQMTTGTANVLRSWGAKEDLIAFLVPDDKIPTIPMLPPYKLASIKPAQEYDPAAKEGWIKISTELAPGSQTEFFFKHNALFVKPLQGDEPKEVQAYFNKPAPHNKTGEFIDVECGLESPAIQCGQEVKEEKKGGLRLGLPKSSKTKTATIEYSYVAPDNDGRAGFQIAVSNPDKTAQKYSVYLRWRALDAPRPPLPSSDSKGGKR
jgi:hypothetical protein